MKYFSHLLHLEISHCWFRSRDGNRIEDILW